MAKEIVTTPLRKITSAAVMTLPRSGKMPKPDKSTVLFYVYGVATDAQLKPTGFSDMQMVLFGNFEVVRPEIAIGEFKREGAKFTSDTLYLPEPYNTRLANTVAPAPIVNKTTGEVTRQPKNEVEFALEVSYAPGESPTGYVFNVKSIVEDRTADKMAAIRGNVDKLLPKLLAAPAKA